MFSTVGVFSTMADIMTIVGGYEYRGGYSVPWGIHEDRGGVQCHGDIISTVGDITSTVGILSTMGYHDARGRMS